MFFFLFGHRGNVDSLKFVGFSLHLFRWTISISRIFMPISILGYSIRMRKHIQEYLQSNDHFSDNEPLHYAMGMKGSRLLDKKKEKKRNNNSMAITNGTE